MAHIEQITQRAYRYYRGPPHPSEIAAAQLQLKRGVDEDWQASVQRYPEVLEYFYSLVTVHLPSDSASAVKDPPLSALNGSRKNSRRVSGIAGPSMDRARTPPALEPMMRERRHSGMRDRRRLSATFFMPGIPFP
jgi:hypothetical protein